MIGEMRLRDRDDGERGRVEEDGNLDRAPAPIARESAVQLRALFAGEMAPFGDLPAAGGGEPWADVRSGANSCAAAVGNGSANDYPALSCQISYMGSTYAGGLVYLPCGNYNLNGHTLSVLPGVILQGESRACTIVKNTTDVTVIAFPISAGGNDYNGFRDLTVEGNLTPGATQDVVTIGNNSATFLRDFSIYGGHYALNNCGVDGTVENGYVSGYSGGLHSCGANWYLRVKFDGPYGIGVATTYAYFQAQPFAGATSAENHFVMCDFSGTWTDSVDIADTTSATITQFEGSVFAATISLTSGQQGFVNNELGAGIGFAIGASATTIVSSNLVLSGTLTLSNSGTLKCGVNSGITNSGC